jgi:SAM-dependent methyltransferase
MIRFLVALAALLALPACQFQGGGLAPFTPAPVAPAEQDLDVPYVPTPRRVVAAMLDLAELGPSDYLFDLGSGDGRIAIMAAQRGARALGVDIDPNRIAESNVAAQLAGVEARARFRRQDLFDTPLREATVVTMYLLPGINMRLRPRLLTELRPGTRLVTHAFTLGDWRPDAQREVDAANIYLWIVPAPVEGQWTIADPGGTMSLTLDQRFQEVSGTLRAGGRDFALRDVTLRGTRLAFSVDLPGGARTFTGLAEGDAIVAVPGSGAWRARRAG